MSIADKYPTPRRLDYARPAEQPIGMPVSAGIWLALALLAAPAIAFLMVAGGVAAEWQKCVAGGLVALCGILALLGLLFRTHWRVLLALVLTLYLVLPYAVSLAPNQQHTHEDWSILLWLMFAWPSSVIVSLIASIYAGVAAGRNFQWDPEGQHGKWRIFLMTSPLLSICFGILSWFSIIILH